MRCRRIDCSKPQFLASDACSNDARSIIPDVLGFCMIGLQVTDQSIAFNDAGGVISGGDTQFLILNVVKHNP